MCEPEAIGALQPVLIRWHWWTDQLLNGLRMRRNKQKIITIKVNIKFNAIIIGQSKFVIKSS